MKLSIIITASFIPSHPSIKIIKKTIESLDYIKMNKRKEVKIILAHDFSDHPDYDKYFENLKSYIENKSNFVIARRTTHGHLTGNIKNAFDYVNSKFVLIVQHDLPFIREFNIDNIIKDMESNKKLKHVRFNKRRNIRVGFDRVNNLFGEIEKCKNYEYTRTPGWSDNNHLCLSDYYRKIIFPICEEGTPMEMFIRKIHRKEYRENKHNKVKVHNQFGTYIFGPLNNKKMITHINGKKTI